MAKKIALLVLANNICVVRKNRKGRRIIHCDLNENFNLSLFRRTFLNSAAQHKMTVSTVRNPAEIRFSLSDHLIIPLIGKQPARTVAPTIGFFIVIKAIDPIRSNSSTDFKFALLIAIETTDSAAKNDSTDRLVIFVFICSRT